MRLNYTYIHIINLKSTSIVNVWFMTRLHNIKKSDIHSLIYIIFLSTSEQLTEKNGKNMKNVLTFIALSQSKGDR